MTIMWFIVWLIANNVGGHEPLLFNPLNAWTATLILAVGLDLWPEATHSSGVVTGHTVAGALLTRTTNPVGGMRPRRGFSSGRAVSRSGSRSIAALTSVAVRPAG